MFYLCYLLVIYFLKFLLAIRSENQQMDGSLACYEELGVWCNFNIPWFDSSPRPRVRGDGEIAPNIAKKNIWQSLIRQLAVTKRLDVWKLKTTLSKGDNCPIFWWKTHQSSFAHFRGSLADSFYKFRFRASLVLLSFARWHRYRADSALLWRMM